MRPLDQMVSKDLSAPTVPASDLHALSDGFDLPELARISSPGISQSIFAATSALSLKDFTATSALSLRDISFSLGVGLNPVEHDPFHVFPSAWLRCVGDCWMELLSRQRETSGK